MIKVNRSGLCTETSLKFHQRLHQTVRSGDPTQKFSAAKEFPENQDRLQIHSVAGEKRGANFPFSLFLSQLHRDYPNIHIMIESSSSDGRRDILAEVLDRTGEGYLLILSKEFMESLHTGKESYDRKTKVLLSCMQKLSGFQAPTGLWLEEDLAVYWTNVPNDSTTTTTTQAQKKQSGESWISQMLPSPSEREAQKLRPIISSPYRTAASYTRMAQAKNKMAVQTVMQQTRRDIASLKLISAYGDDDECSKAKAAIRSLQKLLLRGNKKMKKFSEEMLTQQRIERANKKSSRKKELQAKLELKRQKTSRAIFDGIVRKESQLEQLNGVPIYRRNKWFTEKEQVGISQVPINCDFSESETPTPTNSPSTVISVVEVVAF